MKNAIILSGIAWNATQQRHHNVANWLYKLGYNVFFVEKITSSKFTIKKLLNQVFKQKQNAIKNPENEIKVISSKFLNPEFRKINEKICQEVLKQLPYEVDLVINYLPIETTMYLLEKIKYKKLIYDCVRDFSKWGYYSKNIVNIEKKLIEMSDLILTDSYYLTDKIKTKYQNKKVVQLLPIIEKTQKNISEKSPRKQIKNILYYGSVGAHVDTRILKKLASDGYIINIMGQIDIKLNFQYVNLGYYSNKEKMIKKIMEVADAIIIPYKGNMDGVIPVKLLESIKTLKPIYISSFYDSNKLEKYLYVYKDYDELKKMLNNYTEEKHLEKIRYMKTFLEKDEVNNQYETFKKEVNLL